MSPAFVDPCKGSRTRPADFLFFKLINPPPGDYEENLVNFGAFQLALPLQFCYIVLI